MKFRIKLRTKFSLILLFLAALPVSLVGWQLISINQRAVQGAILELHTKMAQKLAVNVEKELAIEDQKLEFALTALQKNLSWDDQRDLLKSLVESSKGILEIAFLDSKGMEFFKVVASTRAGGMQLNSHSEEKSFREFLAGGKKILRIDPAEQVMGKTVPVLRMYLPLRRGGCFVMLSLQAMKELVAEERLGGTGFAMMVDFSGDPILYPEGRFQGADRLKEVSQWPIVKQSIKAVSIGSSEYEDASGTAYVGAYAPIPVLDASMLTVQLKTEAYVTVSEMRRRAMTFLLVLGVLALVIAYIISRRLVQPLLALTRGAHEMSLGNFTHHVEVTTHDELRDLADTFNRMTERLRNYAQLQIDRLIEEQEKTEAILFSIEDGIVMTDYEGRILLANRQAKKILGISLNGSLEEKRIQDCLPREWTQEVLDSVRKNPTKGLMKDLVLSADGAGKRFFKALGRTVIAPGKREPQGVVIAFRDVSLEKEIEAMKEQFIHSITHDLKNPIQCITGYMETMKLEPLLTPLQNQVIENTNRATKKLLDMIQNILDVAKIEAKKMSVVCEPWNLEKIVSRIVEMNQGVALRRKIDLKMEVHGQEPAFVDAALLERVFTNLIGNALKFTSSGGEILVRLQQEKEHWLCSVRDTGEGIPSAYLQKVFEKFQQVEKARRGGSGLGLTICKYIVEAHGGKIWVESQVGVGSEIFFTVPLVPDAPAQAAQAAAADQNS
ncbi:MAG: HAMP domain-containing protein [Elusimicrobia bacterium]|nr:HAMP domain-containing protein [Elusimicrobiota bacterium]